MYKSMCGIKDTQFSESCPQHFLSKRVGISLQCKQVHQFGGCGWGACAKGASWGASPWGASAWGICGWAVSRRSNIRLGSRSRQRWSSCWHSAWLSLCILALSLSILLCQRSRTLVKSSWDKLSKRPRRLLPLSLALVWVSVDPLSSRLTVPRDVDGSG